jgi:hypothetical protein
MPPTDPNTGIAASTTPKQVISTADSSTGQSTAGALGETIPTAETQRSRPPERTERDERARSRSEKRKSAAENAKTDKAAELTAAAHSAVALAAAAETEKNDKAAQQGAAAAALATDNEPAAAEAVGTPEQGVNPPKKHRNTESGTGQATDDAMSEDEPNEKPV